MEAKKHSKMAGLWENMKGYRLIYLVAVLGTVAYNVLQLTVPYITQNIVDLFLTGVKGLFYSNGYSFGRKHRMKAYNAPLAEITELQTQDIVTFSIPDINAKYDDTADASGLDWFK